MEITYSFQLERELYLYVILLFEGICKFLGWYIILQGISTRESERQLFEFG